MTRIISNAIRQQIDQETRRLQSVKSEINRQRTIMSSQRVLRRGGRENQLNRKRFNEEAGRVEGNINKDIKRLREIRKLPTVEEERSRVEAQLRHEIKRGNTEDTHWRDRYGTAIRLGKKVHTKSFGTIFVPRDQKSLNAEVDAIIRQQGNPIFRQFSIKPTQYKIKSPFFINEEQIRQDNIRKATRENIKFKLFGIKPNTRVKVHHDYIGNLGGLFWE